MVAELAWRYKRLSRSELEVIPVLRRLTQGGSIYKVWIAQDELVRAMSSPDLPPDHCRRLLANMRHRGILEEASGWWRAVW